MCETCGCTIGGRESAPHTLDIHAVEVLENLLAQNDHTAAHNREHFNHHGVLAVNLMSSPGAGKTALLEATIDALKDEFAIAVIEGDLETENDAQRIRAHGVAAVQITTGSTCHLDAAMVHEALHEMSLDGLDLLFIENVGNLVCPASFDLGQHLNVTLLSAPEGDDKPAKYPVMFRAADLVVLSKSDLLPLLEDFSVERATRGVRQLASTVPVLTLSARKGRGLEAWFAWLRQMRTDVRNGVAVSDTPVLEQSRVGAHAHAERR